MRRSVPICIVIPVVPQSGGPISGGDVVAAFEETLVSVLENRPEDCEIVAVLGCEYADPWNIRDEVVFIRAPQGSSLTACVNLGICSSRAAVVHVLCPGWRATPGWVEAALARFANPSVGAVVPVAVAEKDRSQVVSQGIRVLAGGRRVECRPSKGRGWRASVTTAMADGPTLAAGFWRSELFAIDGPGFTTACGDGLADADMALTTAAAGWECSLAPESRVVAPAQTGKKAGGLLAGLHAERLFWRGRGGQPLAVPLTLHLLEVIRHAAAAAPWGTAAVLLGRLLAIAQFGSYVARYKRLRQVRAAVLERSQSEAAATAEGRPAILRLDGPHQAPAAPHEIRRSDRYRRSA